MPPSTRSPPPSVSSPPNAAGPPSPTANDDNDAVDDGEIDATIDNLLQTRNIDDLSVYSRRLTQDIDRKREELRTMVGERYRDLMEAAETIMRMRDSAQSVIETSQELLTKGHEINAKALGGGGMGQASKALMASAAVEPPEAFSNGELPVAAQIKLLMAAPERIWEAQEEGNFLLAAQMYLFARHIHTCLTLATEASSDLPSTPGQMTAAQISTCFPVVSRQWASIAHFYDAILQGCQKTLESCSDATSTVHALATLLLLQGLTATDAFETLLRVRRTAMEAQLKEDRQKATAKTMIGRSIRVLMSTLEAVNVAFVEGGLSGEVGEAKDTPTLQLLQAKSSPVLKFLPAIVRDFSPTLVKPLQDLDREYLKSALRQWLDGVHDLIQAETRSLLCHVTSITALSSIRRNIYDLLMSGGDEQKLQPEIWDAICLEVLGKDLNLWDEFYRGLFRDQTESLIKTQVAGSVYCVQSSLASEGQENAPYCSERNLADYLWTESSISEVDIFPKKDPVGFKREKKSAGVAKRCSTLELKSKGYSPRVQSLCEQFDSTLQKMLDDLSIYVTANEAESKQPEHDPLSFLHEPKPELREPFHITADNDSLLKFIQETLVAQLEDLLAHVEKAHKGNAGPGMLLFLGRFFQALPELCPYLSKCVNAPTEFATEKKSDAFLETSLAALQQRRAAANKVDPVWAGVKTKLEAESVKMLQEWIVAVTAALKIKLETALPESDSSVLLRVLPAWDEIDISETTEDGSEVKSRIRVPMHPSVAWFTAVTAFCAEVYSVAPYSLPTAVQQALSQEPAKSIVTFYEAVSKREKLGQKIALQLHFDLQLVQQSMVTRENRDLATATQTVLSQFETHIDPFDLSVFSPYMSLHVKRAILREHGLLSVLIPNDRYGLMASIKSSLATTTPTLSDSQQQTHNSMWMLGHRQEKIPLIPVPRRVSAAAAAAAADVAAQSRITRGSLQPGMGGAKGGSMLSPVMGRRKRDKSPMAKATGGFFEAMTSSGWFGAAGANK